jgi:ABC-type multidrug transport system fused ATPase/permease subunit
MDFANLSCWLNAVKLPASGLSSVSSVGVGLYLGLAVIQIIGAGKMARLRRKFSNLRNLIDIKGNPKYQNRIHDIDADFLRLEIAFDSLSGIFLKIVFLFVALALVGLSWTTLAPQHVVGGLFASLFVACNLLLPLLLFSVASAIVRRKCRSVSDKIRKCEDSALEALSGFES